MRDSGEEAVDRELESMAGRSEIAREVKESLLRMKNGDAGPEMAEMARDLLEGRLRLRDLSTTEVYSGPLMEGIDRYRQWESELTPDQRKALEDQVRDRFGVDMGDPITRHSSEASRSHCTDARLDVSRSRDASGR